MLKIKLKGDQNATISDIQTSVTTKLKTIPITDFLRVMQWLEDRANQCIAVNGDTWNKKICLEFFSLVFEAQSQNLWDTPCM